PSHYPLSLHDALPIYDAKQILATEAQHDQTFATELSRAMHNVWHTLGGVSESTVEQVNITTSGATMRKSVIAAGNVDQSRRQTKDRKSTRLNSSHVKI